MILFCSTKSQTILLETPEYNPTSEDTEKMSLAVAYTTSMGPKRPRAEMTSDQNVQGQNDYIGAESSRVQNVWGLNVHKFHTVT